MPAKKGQKIESKYNGEKLYALIKEGKTSKEIMHALGIDSMPTLKSHLFRLMNERKEFLAIADAGIRTRATSPVYRGGKIVITANMLSGIEFTEGQKFTLRKTEDGLKLKFA